MSFINFIEPATAAIAPTIFTGPGNLVNNCQDLVNRETLFVAPSAENINLFNKAVPKISPASPPAIPPIMFPPVNFCPIENPAYPGIIDRRLIPICLFMFNPVGCSPYALLPDLISPPKA